MNGGVHYTFGLTYSINQSRVRPPPTHSLPPCGWRDGLASGLKRNSSEPGPPPCPPLVFIIIGFTYLLPSCVSKWREEEEEEEEEEPAKKPAVMASHIQPTPSTRTIRPCPSPVPASTIQFLAQSLSQFSACNWGSDKAPASQAWSLVAGGPAGGGKGWTGTEGCVGEIPANEFYFALRRAGAGVVFAGASTRPREKINC
ncbi:unnamed protein product [Lota lota]